MRMLIPPMLAAICLACLSSGAIATADDVPVSVEGAGPFHAPLVRDVIPSIRTIVDMRLAPGVTVLVADTRSVQLKAAVGWRSPPQSEPLAPTDIYWLASITKPIVATAFMTLVDEGRCDLDDPVSKFLPDFEELRSADGTPAVITIRHCLTHTSGLSYDRTSRIDSIEQSVSHMVARPLDFSPGTQWKYSRSLDVVARIAEVLTQTSFPDFLRERLLAPLDMSDTTFNLSKDQATRVILPSELDATTGGLRKAETDAVSFDPDDLNWPAPSYGLFSTAGDLGKFAMLMLNRGKVGDRRLLSERAIEAMTTLQTEELTTGWTPGNGWGLGWCVIRYPQHVTRSLSPGSYGHGGVYGPQLWIDTERGIAEVLLFERKDIANADGSDLREAFHVAVARSLAQREKADR